MRSRGKSTGALAGRLGRGLETDEAEAARMSKVELAKSLAEEGVNVRPLVRRFRETIAAALTQLNYADWPAVVYAAGGRVAGGAANLAPFVEAHVPAPGRDDEHGPPDARVHSAKSIEEAQQMFCEGLQAYKDNHMEAAIEHWREAKKRYLFLNMLRQTAACERNIGYAYERMGRSADAKEQFERARAIYLKADCAEEAGGCAARARKQDRPTRAA